MPPTPKLFISNWDQSKCEGTFENVLIGKVQLEKRETFYVVSVSAQSRSQSFVPLDQRSENESSGSNHYERTKEITEFWLLIIRLTAHLHLWRMPEMVAPRALVFLPLVKGNEALGTRLVSALIFFAK